MGDVLVAVSAVGLCYLSVVFFKVAAGRVDRLGARRPGHLVRQVMTDRVWLMGVFVFGMGLETQVVAFTDPPGNWTATLFILVPALLLPILIVGSREQPPLREWLGLGLFAVALVFLTTSGRHFPGTTGELPSVLLLLAVVLPSLALPAALLQLGDRKATGRHARPRPGTVHALGCGVLIGIGEVAVKGLALVNEVHAGGPGLLTEPYPYLILVAMGMGLCQGTLALQRSRPLAFLSISSVVALTYLLVIGPLLYDGGWPHDPAWAVLRLAGVTLAIAALICQSREEPADERTPPRHSRIGPSGSPPFLIGASHDQERANLA